MDKREYPALRESVHHAVLENGLHIYVVPRPKYGQQFAFFATRYGGMNLRFRMGEGPWADTPAGVAHFLEHKLFDTKEGNALQIMAANGVDPNAFTSSNITGYYFEGSRGFEENLRTLLTFVSQPYFTQQSVDKEQGIIAQEIRMGEDNPDQVVFYQLMDALYAANPIKVRVAGSVESIGRITADTLYQCHGAFYHPGNMVLCVSGDVDPRRVEELAREVLPGGRAPGVETDFGPPEPREVSAPLLERQMPVAVPLFELGFKGDPAEGEAGFRQELVAELACEVLLGASSPLYSRLYEEGLINSTFSYGYEAEPGCAFVAAGGESKDPAAVREAIWQEAARLSREGVDDGLWARQKKAAYGGMVRRLNSLSNLCIDLAQSHFDGADYLSFPQLYQQIEKKEAEALIASWCVPERTALSVVRPKEEL